MFSFFFVLEISFLLILPVKRNGKTIPASSATLGFLHLFSVPLSLILKSLQFIPQTYPWMQLMEGNCAKI